MSEHQRRALVRVLRDEVARCADRERLFTHARRWLYDHKLLIPHDRVIRTLVASALAELEQQTAAAIRASVSAATLKRWASALETPRPDGQHCQSWLWSAPSKHSTRQITEVLERISYLTELWVDRHLIELNDVLVRRYARRLAGRTPSVSARISEPARTVELGCFLRYCLLTATDQLILMFQRRAADLWRQCADGVTGTLDWALQYRQLLEEVTGLIEHDAVPDPELRARLRALVLAKRTQRPPSRASVIRQRLVDAIAPVRSLLVAISRLPWQATGEHPTLDALNKLRTQYAAGAKSLPADVAAPRLGAAWREFIAGADREPAFRALEVATLFALRRAMRNGAIWIEHSLSFRGRERLFLPDERWKLEARRHYARLQLPAKAADFLAPLIARVRTGVDAVEAAARAGTLRVDDELHLAPLAADQEDPDVVKLRARLDQRIGDDGLCRHPRPRHESDGSRMRAHDSAALGDKHSPGNALGRRRRRLAQACEAVLEFMQRHPIAASWGRADLASSDMMSLETSRRVWQARQDPRRQTASIGIYSHVRDRWGIFHAQPIVLNERQARAAIEGVVRQEPIETSQLAVDTHGYTDFAMGLSRLLGFDLCPRLRERASATSSCRAARRFPKESPRYAKQALMSL